ncbi:hypothetical protein [Paradevosia shaoguanensis]|uniref:hypothetical protein n=1 Tax=Paradevosia shaoguanensis TaxID=1335043 RepID=UPI001931A807|nr:hypothetical protein [Paradevosia shaoguanensis]
MTRALREGWWYRANTEQRLAQIDGGIELGMTARQIALASGGHPGSVAFFANQHGRSLGQSKSTAGVRRNGQRKHDAANYFGGRKVDFWNGDDHRVPAEVEEVSF